MHDRDITNWLASVYWCVTFYLSKICWILYSNLIVDKWTKFSGHHMTSAQPFMHTHPGADMIFMIPPIIIYSLIILKHRNRFSPQTIFLLNNYLHTTAVSAYLYVSSWTMQIADYSSKADCGSVCIYCLNCRHSCSKHSTDVSIYIFLPQDNELALLACILKHQNSWYDWTGSLGASITTVSIAMVIVIHRPQNAVIDQSESSTQQSRVINGC